MGVFSKLKDVLFDVEEEEIPVITKEERTVPVIEKEENPIKEVKMPKEDFLDDIEPIEDHVEDIPKSKKDSNFSFPMDFDDELPARSKRDYFDEEFTLRPLKEERKEEVVKRKNEYAYDYSRLDIRDVKKEETKNFKPSPVISPVYGILDQNYTKDDVIVRNDGSKRKPDLEDVRKKAYGSKKKEKEVKEDKDEFEEPLRTLDEILIEKEEEKEEVVVTPPVKEEEKIEEEQPIEVYDDELPDEPYADEEIEEKSKEDELESDLFNLIDSMYEERNERDEEE